jgi:hypothetical protein
MTSVGYTRHWPRPRSGKTSAEFWLAQAGLRDGLNAAPTNSKLS